jgi:hypothetical protein
MGKAEIWQAEGLLPDRPFHADDFIIGTFPAGKMIVLLGRKAGKYIVSYV